MLTDEKDNLVKIFENSFRDNWELEAITDYGTTNTLTYGQLAARVAQLHILFQQCGIKKEDKISVMGKNNCNWVSVYLATVTYGAVIVPILQDFKANDALHIINHSESKLLFITDLIWESLDLEQMEDVRAVFSLANFKTLASRNDKGNWASATEEFNKKFPNGYTIEDVHYDERPNSAIASINYTSGTTGFSKGVLTPCNALAGNIKFGQMTKELFRGCRHVVFLPLAHAYGCAIDFLGVLSMGGHAYFIGRTPAPKILLQAFKEIRPSAVLSVPLILEKIYKKQIVPQISTPAVRWALKVPYLDEVILSKIRAELYDAFGGMMEELIIGGAPLNAEVEDFLRRIKFPFTIGYGMTECAPLISYAKWNETKLNSCGKVLPGLMSIKVANPDENGVGELLVKGENVMQGYYKNPKATKAVFTKDGWLKTGDLGYIDEDGFIFIKGRNKTMLLGPNGQNIYPEAIEAKLNNMPFVMESIVLQHEEHLIALVCPDYEAVDAEHLSPEDLNNAMEENRKQLNAELASYEPIVKIKLYPHEFEKTPKKSVKRFLYTSMAED